MKYKSPPISSENHLGRKKDCKKELLRKVRPYIEGKMAGCHSSFRVKASHFKFMTLLYQTLYLHSVGIFIGS